MQVLALFGGIQAVLVGLVTYLGKIWLFRLEQNLKHESERSRIAFQLTFETEVKLYKGLMARVGRATSGDSYGS